VGCTDRVGRMTQLATRGRSLPCRLASLAHLEIARSGSTSRGATVARAPRSDCRSRLCAVDKQSRRLGTRTARSEQPSPGVDLAGSLPQGIHILCRLGEGHQDLSAKAVALYADTAYTTAASARRFRWGRPTGIARTEIRPCETLLKEFITDFNQTRRPAAPGSNSVQSQPT